MSKSPKVKVDQCADSKRVDRAYRVVMIQMRNEQRHEINAELEEILGDSTLDSEEKTGQIKILVSQLQWVVSEIKHHVAELEKLDGNANRKDTTADTKPSKYLAG